MGRRERKIKKSIMRLYITYNADGKQTTLVFRSQEAVDEHIKLHSLNGDEIHISDKPPRSPEVTPSSINRMLEFVGDKHCYTSQFKSGVRKDK